MERYLVVGWTTHDERGRDIDAASSIDEAAKIATSWWAADLRLVAVAVFDRHDGSVVFRIDGD